MERQLRLLMLLSGSRSYSTQEIMDRFDISERTVFRLLNQIEDCGFILDRDKGRYRLLHHSRETKILTQLLHFTEQEAYLLYRVLTQIEGSQNAASNLIKKLHALYDFKALKSSKEQDNLEKIQNIAKAIKDKKRVCLLKYHSSNSGDINDREVEAFKFTEGYKSVWCIDLNDKTIKQFNISRMENVLILNTSWMHENKHILPFIDIFYMAAPQPIATVEAHLNLKAYNLLIEEYPLSEPYIQTHQNIYILQIPIAGFQGIGRFVLGLPGDIEVISPPDFIQYLKDLKR